MIKNDSFLKDRKDNDGGLIPSDKSILEFLDKVKQPLSINAITELISASRGEEIKKMHITNSMGRVFKRRKVNKHYEKGKEIEWRVGWGAKVNMNADEFVDPVKTHKPQRPIKKDGFPVRSNGALKEKAFRMVNGRSLVKKETVIRGHPTMYASDMDRVKFAHHLGYGTLSEALNNIGSWNFELKLKAHLRTNVL